MAAAKAVVPLPFFGRKLHGPYSAFWCPLPQAVSKSAVVLPKWVDSTVFRVAFYRSAPRRGWQRN